MARERDSYLVETLCVLVDHEVQFVVAGGVAVVLHGVERMTLDLDVAVSLDRKNLERFLVAMRKLELEPRAPVPAELILQPKAVERLIREKNALVFTFWSPREPYRQIDMFLTRENSFDDLVADAQVLPIQGRSIRFASRQKLIEMKRRVQPVRQKDLSDIQALIKIEQDEKTQNEERLRN
ncbi:MAG: hypothetical protein JO069_18475 [Verrucomicrobia bacterium]|nr:hypothetical protein [Verrucomicrobiota bacterium]